MKTKLYHIALSAVAVAMSLTSCVKDELFNTPYPDYGRVYVTTDWSGRSSEASIPDSYTIQIGDKTQQANGENNLFEPLLTPGHHKLMMYNSPQDITVDGTVASVRPTADGISPMPGYLFASLQDINVQADDTLKVAATMQQYVRRIDIELTVKEGDHDRVASVSASLSGVASKVDMTTFEYSNPSTATNAMANDGYKFTVSFRLLGIVPSATNTLVVNVQFTNGETQTIVSDLSGLLRGFNKTVEPLKLTGELFLPIQGGASGTINGWTKVDGGNINAEV